MKSKNHHYHIQRASDRVQAWSEERLALPPKGWQSGMKDQLQTALIKLTDRDNVFQVTYTSADKSDFDVENALFYNVNTGVL